MPEHKMWHAFTLPEPLPPPFRKMPDRPNKRKSKLEADEIRVRKKTNFVVKGVQAKKVWKLRYTWI